jgi:formylglycine-generating enzyme required for sulfatase activity
MKYILFIVISISIIVTLSSCVLSPPKNEEIEGMVFIEGGTFTMGDVWSTVVDPDTHKVTLSSYYIGEKEVTVEDYIEFLNASKTTSDGKLNGIDIIYMNGNAGIYYDSSFYFSPSKFVPNINCSVVGLSWYSACLYCNWYSKECGRDTVYAIDSTEVLADFSKNGYRLPTEAEWEFAARDRGGNINKWSGTNDYWDIEDWIWYEENTEKFGEDHSDYGVHPGGLKFPNALGIYDMSGNVKEWCWDWYGEYSLEHTVDPKGSELGTYKVLRGGSWLDREQSSRVYNRSYMLPYFAVLVDWGIRIAISYDEDD